MMARPRKIDVLLAQLAAVERLVDKLDRRLEKIELVTVVREPATGLAADAYNGLRKQVIAAVTERSAHLHQLARFDTAVRGEASTEHLRALVGEWLAQAEVEVISDPQLEDAFQFVGEADGGEVQVVRPAYVDRATGRVIQSGIAERLPAGVASSMPEVAVVTEDLTPGQGLPLDAPAVVRGAHGSGRDSPPSMTPEPAAHEAVSLSVDRGGSADPESASPIETEPETTSPRDQEQPK